VSRKTGAIQYVITGKRSLPLQSDSVNLTYDELELVTMYRASPGIARKLVKATLREASTYGNEVLADNPNRMQGNTTMQRMHT